MWWAESEDMWQTLACCMEIKNAIDSGDPENFVCHFPVHQDGSCNGLQHYAALGRDVAGGMSVNLLPSPVPQDVYSCVVAMVSAFRYCFNLTSTKQLVSPNLLPNNLKFRLFRTNSAGPKSQSKFPFPVHFLLLNLTTISVNLEI